MILTTEEKILEAAKKVFHQKGYDGARMQEIADEAGINKALVHYYYRNKDNLFQAVFEDAFTRLLFKVNEIFYSTGSILQKTESFLGYYMDCLQKNSFLPMFILNSLYNRPDQLKVILGKLALTPHNLLALIKQQLKEEYNLDIDPMHVYINLLSMVIFPIVARPLIQQIFRLSQKEMELFFEERKKEVPLFIISALKGYSNETIRTNE